jgi:hypothetical protein
MFQTADEGISRADYFRFGLVFIKKNLIKPNFKKKNRNRFKPTGFSSVWFFRTKTGSNRFGSGFFRFFSVWVRFGFFSFRLIKPKPNRTGWFFQNFNRFNQFFFTVRFF